MYSVGGHAACHSSRPRRAKRTHRLLASALRASRGRGRSRAQCVRRPGRSRCREGVQAAGLAHWGGQRYSCRRRGRSSSGLSIRRRAANARWEQDGGEGGVDVFCPRGMLVVISPLRRTGSWQALRQGSGSHTTKTDRAARAAVLPRFPAGDAAADRWFCENSQACAGGQMSSEACYPSCCAALPPAELWIWRVGRRVCVCPRTARTAPTGPPAKQARERTGSLSVACR